MKTNKLEQMVKGWFVGGFSPTAHSTKDCEVAVKKYLKGDKEEKHYHKLATEITLILEGQVIMFNKTWKQGDIITIEPYEATAFEALDNTTTVVVKIPGALDDKYLS